MSEGFISISEVSIRLIEKPEDRPAFIYALTGGLRDQRGTLPLVSTTAAITTMPDTQEWWRRAKEIADELKTQKKLREEHPECAKAPSGKHDWRFGKCNWCGVEAAETGPVAAKLLKKEEKEPVVVPKIETTEIKSIVEIVEGGLLIIVKGHPAAGEKLEVAAFSFKEDTAKDIAKNFAPCYIYQLKYSVRSE